MDRALKQGSFGGIGLVEGSFKYGRRFCRALLNVQGSFVRLF